tara:strand:+ start:957 stop:1379 length:423 start_codon:yes stop_codon:yes gene_type:complete
MKKLNLKKYKDKYVSLKDIYRTIRKGLIFNNKQMSYSVYFNIIILFLTEFIKQVAKEKEKIQMPKKMGQVYIKKELHKRPFHVQIDVNESEKTGKIVKYKVPILNDYYNKLVWERASQYKRYKILPLRRFKELINTVKEY